MRSSTSGPSAEQVVGGGRHGHDASTLPPRLAGDKRVRMHATLRACARPRASSYPPPGARPSECCVSTSPGPPPSWRTTGCLSAVPCVAAFVGILGLLGTHPATTEAVDEIVREGGGSIDFAGVAADAARGVVEGNGAAGLALGAGLLTTLWVASIYLAAFHRAAYRVHGADPVAAWKARPLQLVLTFLEPAAVGRRGAGADGDRADHAGHRRSGWRRGRDGHDLVDRPLAADAGAAGGDDRCPLQPGPARRPSAPAVQRRLGRGRAPVAGVFRGVRGLGGQLRLVRRDLRRARGGDRVRGLAVDLEPGVAVRPGAGPGAGARLQAEAGIVPATTVPGPGRRRDLHRAADGGHAVPHVRQPHPG